MVEQELCLALHVQSAGQNPLGVQPDGHRPLHRPPDLGKEIPNFDTLVQLHIFAQRNIPPRAELLNFGEGIFGVNIVRLLCLLALDHDVAAADGKDAHLADDIAVLVPREKVQRVRMGQRLLGIVAKLDLGLVLAKHLVQHAVGAVPAAGLAQRLVQPHAIGGGVGIALKENAGSTLRTHRVGAGGTLADLIYITN